MPSNATNRTVTGLTNGQEYLFRVAAVNSAGTGPFSSTTTVTPGYFNYTAAVNGSSSHPVSGTYVRWGTLNGKPYWLRVVNDTVSGYLYWQSGYWMLGPTLNGGYGSVWFIKASTAETPPLSGWEPYGYGGDLTLTAVSVGSTSTPGTPSNLALTINPTELALTWTMPTTNGNSVITGYRIEYTPDGGSPQTVDTGSAATSYTLTGLTDDVTYSVRVAALNAVGASNYTSSITGTPGYPNYVAAVNGSSSHPVSGTYVRWGTLNGKPYWLRVVNDTVSGYLYWQSGYWMLGPTLNGGYGSVWFIKASTAETPPLSGWEPYGYGGNLSLTPVASALLKTVPGTTTNLTAIVASLTAVELAWTMPTTNGDSVITGYRIEYTPAGAAAQTVDIGVETNYALTGLTTNTAYSIRVAALNAVGAGAYSNTASAVPDYPAYNATVLGVSGTHPTSGRYVYSQIYNDKPAWVRYTDGTPSGYINWSTTGFWRAGASLSNLATDSSSASGTWFRSSSSGTYPPAGTYPPLTGWESNYWGGTFVLSFASPVPVITITSQPSNQTASNGSATFSVTATATQSATLSYQWQKQESGTGSFSNVSGATSSSLVLSNLTNADDNGDVYRCVVSATGGAESVTSSGATLTVAAATSGWNISSASYARSFSVAAQETNPTSLAFSGDGTKMYVLGSTGDDVNQYALSSAWDISTAVYVQNKVVDDTTPLGIYFAPDGTRMYVTGNFNEAILQYALSTPWDIATASYVNTRGTGQNPRGVFFKSDGTSYYIAKTGVVEEYSLSVPWDITSETYLRAFSTPQDTSMHDVFFKPDGTAMYLIGATNDKVYEYVLSSPWNVSTATYVRDFGFSVQEPSPTGVYFKDDGTRMYIVGAMSDSVHEYSL